MAAEPIDVREELAAAAVRPFHWWLVVLVALATIFDGFDTFIPSYMIHFVLDEWQLSPAQSGFLVSSGLIGFNLRTHTGLSETFRSSTLAGRVNVTSANAPSCRSGGVHGGCGALGAKYRKNGRSLGAVSRKSSARSAKRSVA